MRIGMIAPPWLAVPPQRYGGIEAMVDTLAIALAEAGHEVVLAASSDSTCPVTRIEGLPPSDPATLGSVTAELRHAVLAYRALEDAGVEVVHDHTVVGPHTRSRPDRLPVVTTLHGPVDRSNADILSALPGDVDLIAISAQQATSAPDLPFSRVIHHGVDADRIPVGAGDGGYACFLGRMSPDKGVSEAIRVARAAGIPLRIAAKMHEPAELEYFRREVKPLLGRDVDYLGELGARDKFDLLGGASALLNPIAWDEPFGMVMIESFATGTPVITTGRGAAAEIVEDGVTGFIRPSLPELAAALVEVERLDRARCRAVTENYFSARRMAQEYAEVFHTRSSVAA